MFIFLKFVFGMYKVYIGIFTDSNSPDMTYQL